MKFKHHLLGDLIRVKHGFAFKSEYFSFESGEKIVLTPGNFYEEGGFKLRPNKDRYYSGDYPHDFLLKKNDLIIAMTEQTYGLLGSPALIPENNKYLHNQRLGKFELLRNNQVSVFFLYYLFHIKGLRDEISNTASGTKIRHTAPERISKIKIPLPPLPIQKKIAAVLSAYDDLIENNNRRIALLEKMAEELYREWFVRLRFPGHDNVKIIKGVPEGWEVVELNQIASETSISTKSGINLADRYYLPIDLLQQKHFNPNSHLTYDYAQSSLVKFNKGDILFGAMRPYLHKVCIAPFNGITRTTCFVIRPKKENYYSYLYLLLFQNSTIDFSTLICNGADRPYVVWNNAFEKMLVFKPTENLVFDFNKLIKPIIMNISRKYFLLNKLKEIRDRLLSRLMSGKIDTENLDIRFPKSMMEEEGHG